MLLVYRVDHAVEVSLFTIQAQHWTECSVFSFSFVVINIIIIKCHESADARPLNVLKDCRER